MVQRQNQNSATKSDSYIAGISVGVYLVLLLVLIFVIRFDIKDLYSKPDTTGVLINFGDRSLGEGKKVSNVLSQAHSTQPKPKSKPNVKPAPEAKKEIVQEEHKDANIKSTQNVTTPKPNEAKPKVESVKRVEESVKAEEVSKESVKKEVEVVEEKPVINQGALYKRPKQTNTKEAGEGESHGATEDKSGNTGKEEGQIGAPGDGGKSQNFSLSGRTLIGELAKPDYNEKVSGQVVIEIQVNRDGKVIETAFKPQNSTITSRIIIEAARKAASQTRFNADPNASFTQVGTIIYILKVE